MVFPFGHSNIPHKVLYPISIQVAGINNNRCNDRRIEDILKDQEVANLDNKIFFTRSSKYFLFQERISELMYIEDNWDGYGGYAPDINIAKKVEKFIKRLPQNYLNALVEDGIFPNPHGTITVEWRKESNVVSIEFGQTNSGFYSILDGQKESEGNLNNILSSKKLINALNSIIA